MIRIAHLTTVHPWEDTRIFQRMCRSSADQGYDTHLVVPMAGSPATQNLHGVQIHAVPLPRTRRERMLRTVRDVFQVASHINADIYHFHDLELMRVGLKLRRRAHVIYDAHENVATDMLIKPWLPRPLRGTVASFATWVERYGCRRMSAVVAAGDDIADRLRTIRPDVVCVRNYPDLRGFEPPASRDARAIPRRHFLFLGGVDATSLPFDVADALYLIPTELEPLLVWGGKRCIRPRFEALQCHPGWNRVNYVGPIPFEELRDYLYGAVAALVLYHNAPFCHRIRSNRLFEAMACGTPVIVPTFGEWPEFVEKYGCGIAVDPHNPKELSAAMRMLLEEPARRDEMGHRGRTAVLQHFSWHDEFAKLDQLYRRL